MCYNARVNKQERDVTTDKITKRLEKRQAELAANQEAIDRWLKKLLRAATAIEKLRQERKRLLKPRQLEPHESAGITSTEWHIIREQELNDTIGF